MSKPTPSSSQKKYDTLKNNILFRKFSSETLRCFSECSSLVSYKKGETLFLHHDRAENFYMIVSGWIKIYRDTLDGSEIVLDVIPEGSLLGETALFNHCIYEFSATAIEDCQVVSFPLSLLSQQLQHDNSLALQLLEYIAQRNNAQNKELEHRDSQTTAQRIGCFLLRLMPKQLPSGKVTLQLPYDKTLLASRLGMKPETFSRGLSKLSKDVNLHIKGATVTINDISQFSDYCCMACSDSYPCGDLPDKR